MIEVKINKLYGPEDQKLLEKDRNDAKMQHKNSIKIFNLPQYVGWVCDSITDLYTLKAEHKSTRVIAYFNNKERPYSEYLNIVYYKYMYLESIQFDNENIDLQKERLDDMLKNVRSSLE